MEHKPGDIANGYMLGRDGQWRPLAAPPQAGNAERAPGYLGRYGRRWWKTGLAMGIITTLAVILNPYVNGAPATGVFDWLVGGFLMGWLVWGSLLNLIVAIPRGRST